MYHLDDAEKVIANLVATISGYGISASPAVRQGTANRVIEGTAEGRPVIFKFFRNPWRRTSEYLGLCLWRESSAGPHIVNIA